MNGNRSLLAGLGVGAFAVLCCAALPLLIGLGGGVALGSVLGVGAGALVAILAIAGLIAWMLRRRASSQSGTSDNGHEGPR